MEENKNNAVKKAENRLNKPKKKKNARKTPIKKQAEKRDKIKEQKEIARQQKKERKEQIKANKEKIQAEKRIETARIKAHKKAEKEKAKATALREKNRRKLQLKEKRQAIKEEKQKRRELLKNETKKQRQDRLAKERHEKRQLKEQKHNDRVELKKRKLEEKRQRKNLKESNKQKNKEQGRSRGVGGWLAAVITLGVTTLVLASALTFTMLMPTENDNSLEASYQKSFLDTVEQVENIDLNLSKALATKDTSAMQLYLVNTAINSELAENDLQQLPLQDENKFYTTKLINQIGDYSKYLNNKLARGESLTQTDRAGLVQLYQANARFKNTLNKLQSQMSSGFNFSSMGGATDGNLVLDNFNELQNLSVEYPELIYDGPFSDGLDRREAKGLTGEEITSAEAKEIFTKTFNNLGLEKIESVGESSGVINCYNVQAMVKGEPLYAQISKKGGKVIMFDYAGSCADIKFTEETAISTASEFLQQIGLKNMGAVWGNLTNNVYTINFAYIEDGIVIYPDLVKVRVCAETDMVIGLEASSYYMNHTDRVIAKASITESQASKSVSDFIKIKDSRICVVPFGNSSEKLCYEFIGEYDDSTYYVYVDALNGRQIEMFKVVTNQEGLMLM